MVFCSFSPVARLPFQLRGVLAAALLAFAATPSAAQQDSGSSGATAATGDAAETPRLTIEEVEARLEEMNASDLEQAIKDSLKSEYEAAIEALRAAREYAERAEEFARALEDAPTEIARLREELETLPEEPTGEVSEGLDAAALREALESRRADLADLQARVREAGEAQDTLTKRPTEIGERLTAAGAELAEVEKQLAPDVDVSALSPGRLADVTLLWARREALEAELLKLRQEQLSQTIRSNLPRVRTELLEKKQSLAQESLARLQDRLEDARGQTAENFAARVEELDGTAAEASGLEDSETRELAGLVEELEDTAEELGDAVVKQGEVAERLEELEASLRQTREEVDLGGLEGELSGVLVRQLRHLPGSPALASDVSETLDLTREAQLEEFRIAERLANLELPLGEGPGPQATQRTELRREILSELRANYEALVGRYARLMQLQGDYADRVSEMREYLRELIFWERSSTPLDRSFFQDLPEGARWFFQSGHWRELVPALRRMAVGNPFVTFLAAALFLFLLLLRGRIERGLLETGRRIRRVSSDRYRFTLQALFQTLLLALPVPLLFAILAWGSLRHGVDSGWLRGLGQGLAWSGAFLGGALVLREAGREGGLGRRHFGWSERLCKRLGSALIRIVIVLVPAYLIVYGTLFDQNARHFDSVGRLAFIAAHVWMAWVLYGLLRPRGGMFSQALESRPRGALSRTRYLWSSLGVVSPLALVVLACAGHFSTALALSLGVQGTLLLVVAGVVVYGLVARWFAIKERGLVLAEAIARRRARREAEAAEAGEESVSEGPIAVDEDQLELDLEAVGKQTRRILRSLVVVGAIVAVWLLWVAVLPLDDAPLDADGIAAGAGWLDFLQAGLVLVVSVIIIRDLPGLLDLAGLRDSGMDSGTRYALATLCQYLLTAIAIVVLLRTLEIDLTRFGWLAAALGVGLGFGLQEIVANFVCGIILLFERPIRIGDIVTLGDTTGTVTRIRMRATTITNWDYQEFVVPNKAFITGSLINWTLSNSVNRLTVPVSLARGGDSALAMSILGEVAESHPLVLDDPAPFITFEGFSENSMNIVLRCYLPDIDSRLTCLSELHAAVTERFEEAGLRIAIPQRDVHIHDSNSRSRPQSKSS